MSCQVSSDKSVCFTILLGKSSFDLCKSTFWSVAIITQIILACKIAFWLFLTSKIAAILSVQKTAKMLFYKQV